MSLGGLQLERFNKHFTSFLALIMLSFLLVACSTDDFPHTDQGNTEDSMEEDSDVETEEPSEEEGTESSEQDETVDNIDDSTQATKTAQIKKMTNCDLITAALGNFVANHELEDYSFSDQGFSCSFRPLQETNEHTGEASGYITVIGSYTSMFVPAEELEKQEIYDVYFDERVEAFGGVALGINEHDGNDVVTQIQTPDFEISINVTNDQIELMYGEPSIDVILELIELVE